MTLPDVLITKKDFISSKWGDIINIASEKNCRTYNSLLANKSQEYSTNKDDKNYAIFSLLSSVTQFYLKSESSSDPFGPLFQFYNSRGLIPSDFTENNIKSLESLFELIEDCELRARVADVLWLRTRDHTKAQKGVHAYIESAKNLENPESWPPAAERIERALRLAASLKNSDLIKKVFSHIEKTLKKYDGTDPMFFSSKLMEFLLEFKMGNPEIYIPICRKVAEQSLKDSNWHRARTYFEVEAKWHQLSGNNDKHIEALVQEAEAYVKEAAAVASSNNPSFLAASSHLHKAIEAYRRIGGHKERVEEIHKTLLKYQKNVPSEMKKISHTMDIGDIVKNSQEKVTGKSFAEAIKTLALLSKSPSIQDLEKRTKKIMKDHPIQFIFSRTGINSEGKVISKKPNADLDDDNQNKAAIRAEMYEQSAMIDSVVTTQGMIEPARRIIISEHNGAPNDFSQFIRNNPFIPEGREILYARALSAGLQGDLTIFLSIATPQVENSIRYLLDQNGIPTSKVDQDGIQKEIDLNELLFKPEVIKILGEDLTFDLQGLLVLPIGANLRNRFAHGLLDGEDFNSIHVLYFWWLTLRIIVLCLINYQKLNEKKEDMIKK